MSLDVASSPVTQRSLVRHSLRVRRASVAEITDLSPKMRRVLLRGPELEGFTTSAPDDHIKLLLPSSPDEPLVLPEMLDGRVLWGQARGRIVARDYTPVRFDEESRTLELHLFLHGSGGFASQWATRAKPGDEVGIAGPRGSYVFSQSPPRLLMIGDETALPAMGRWLRELGAGTLVTVVVEVAELAERRALETDATSSVTWAKRGTGLGDPHAELTAVLRRLPRSSGSEAFAWIAGEATCVSQTRRFLVDERNFNPASISARGYWRTGVSDHQEPHED